MAATTATQIRAQLILLIVRAKKQGRPHIEVNAGDLHRMIGGYPPQRGQSHRMPMICEAMLAEAALGNSQTIYAPGGKKGASLTIRYNFPRPERN